MYGNGLTPYQLDLEVKDRKPDIVPKVGDKVKIKSREWYEKWKDAYGNVSLDPLSYWGNGDMVNHLGRIYSVKDVGKECFVLDNCHAYIWSMNMFEEVYPQESSKEVKCAKAFDSLGVSARALEESVKAYPSYNRIMEPITAVPSLPAINPVQGIGIATDWSKIISDTTDRITLPQSCFGSTSAVVHQNFFTEKEPELQMIKKHRFIKLEKL